MPLRKSLVKDMYNYITEKYIPKEEWLKVADKLKPVKLKKGEYLIKQNEIPKNIAFVSSGILRYFFKNKKGVERTIAFRSRGQFTSAYTSYYENRASTVSIQALKKTTLLTISISCYEDLINTSPCWRDFSWKQIMDALVESERREMEFLSYDGETKYKNFKKEFPNLEEEISQHHVASYLGMTNVSLSRIRKKLLRA